MRKEILEWSDSGDSQYMPDSDTSEKRTKRGKHQTKKIAPRKRELKAIKKEKLKQVKSKKLLK